MKPLSYLLIASFILCSAAIGPQSAEAASDTKKLESAVYVTPLGTPIIRAPKGWTPTVLVDEPPAAYVSFTNSERTVSMVVGVGRGYSEAETALGKTERIIALYKNGGKKAHGKVVKNKRIRLGIAYGFDLEMKQAGIGGKSRVRYIAVDTVGPDYSYTVAAEVPEKEWKKYKPVLEASFKTLRIPKSFTLLKPRY
ncbi:MAG: hypothetical protein QOE22_371 [Candidatus Parcubacteria bacterium]|jgi:hypothetical protein|nr:hypothetical protein [Candidatus Parcubacteria bacterium]